VIAASPITLATEIPMSGSNEQSIAIGMNLKPIQIYGGGLNFLLGIARETQLTGSGMGFDLGIQTKLNKNTSFGVVVRNIATSYTYTSKSQWGTIDGSGSFTAWTTAESTTRGPDTVAPEVGIGFGITMPETDTLVALDVENYSYADNGNLNKSLIANDIHIGVEQAILFNGLVFRAGYFSYSPTKDTFFTYGLAMNIYPFDFGMAASNSQKDQSASSALIQLGVTL
jgi:hypothetical protein